MSGRVIFLLEEPSMKTFLLEFLPRLIPGWQHERDFLLLAHEGKSDLEASIARKLKAWREPQVRFVIVRDNDNADCLALKRRLLALASGSGREVLVRLVCQELEAWYLADTQTLSKVYPDCAAAIRRLGKRFPNPDACPKPSASLKQAIACFQKTDAARRMGKALPVQTARSASLQAFVTGLERLVGKDTASQRGV
ncbi:hypothetical protein Ttaiw_01492 [Tepidimonas taiwanensis]|uniref:DUF4276 domain-containing protein n=1 Tax=Tepidimonas taiwanensis TaxID=307486 RepID=A0A554X6T0_9BURK|nr:hypothetical protein Ttaiw_01492 [Tepidimonas taiwanensis]